MIDLPVPLGSFVGASLLRAQPVGVDTPRAGSQPPLLKVINVTAERQRRIFTLLSPI